MEALVKSALPQQPLQAMSSLFEFFHMVERLKTTPRTGWLRHQVPPEAVESISDHMYRMALLCLTLESSTVKLRRPYSKLPILAQIPFDRTKCVQMALCHDLAEALVGGWITNSELISLRYNLLRIFLTLSLHLILHADLTPDDPRIPEKHRLESEAMKQIQQLLQQACCAERAQWIVTLWEEYERDETIEAALVHDLDKFEMLLQADEYERRFPFLDLEPFFESTLPERYRCSIVFQWDEQLRQKRQERRQRAK